VQLPPPLLPARCRCAAAAAGPPPAAPTVPNKGDTAWMMVSTLLVILMTVPGLALFYGGLVRSKNMLSVLMQVLGGVLADRRAVGVYGYSLAFTEGNAFIGGARQAVPEGHLTARHFAMAATFSKGVYIPELLFAAFQATFAGITCA
jgi:Amt family ammonium transporter